MTDSINPPRSVLCILIDDWGGEQIRGWVQAGLSPYRPGETPRDLAATPHLDQFIKEAVLYPNAFVSPICSPTRAQILTGLYPFQSGVGAIVRADGSNGPVDCPVDRGTVYLDASDLGVRTAHFGKLHVVRSRALTEKLFPGQPEAFYPPPQDTFAVNELGADVFRGILRNVNNPPMPENGSSKGRGSYFDWFESSSTGPPVQRKSWVSAAQFEDCGDWIVSDTSPFLAHLWLTATHGPYSRENFPPRELRPASRRPSEDDAWNNAKGMIEAIDDLFGNLRARMNEVGLWDETAVFLLSDNGTDANVIRAQETAGQAFGLDPNRFKGEVYLGGTNVPLAVKMPQSVNRAPGIRRELVDAIDLRPTMIDVLRGDTSATFQGLSQSFAAGLWSAAGPAVRRVSYASRFAPNGSIDDAKEIREAVTFPTQTGLARAIFARKGGTDLPIETYLVQAGREVPVEDPRIALRGTDLRARLRSES